MPALIERAMSATGLNVEIDRVFRDLLGVEPPPPDADLIASGLLDSLSIVSLLVALEQRFEVQITLASLELDNLRTLERIEAMTRKAQSEARSRAAESSLVMMRPGTGRPVLRAPHLAR